MKARIMRIYGAQEKKEKRLAATGENARKKQKEKIKMRNACPNPNVFFLTNARNIFFRHVHHEFFVLIEYL